MNLSEPISWSQRVSIFFGSTLQKVCELCVVMDWGTSKLWQELSCMAAYGNGLRRKKTHVQFVATKFFFHLTKKNADKLVYLQKNSSWIRSRIMIANVISGLSKIQYIV